MSKKLESLLLQKPEICIENPEDIKKVIRDFCNLEISYDVTETYPNTFINCVMSSFENGFGMDKGLVYTYGEILYLLFEAPYYEYFLSSEDECDEEMMLNLIYPAGLALDFATYLLKTKPCYQIKRFLSISFNAYIDLAIELSNDKAETVENIWDMKTHIKGSNSYKEGKLDIDSPKFTVGDALDIFYRAAFSRFLPGVSIPKQYVTKVTYAAYDIYELLVMPIARLRIKDKAYDINNIGRPNNGFGQQA